MKYNNITICPHETLSYSLILSTTLNGGNMKHEVKVLWQICLAPKPSVPAVLSSV